MGTTRVKRLRGKADWTQGELAKKSGVDQGTVSRTEKGKAPGVVTALRLDDVSRCLVNFTPHHRWCDDDDAVLFERVGKGRGVTLGKE